MNRGMRKLGLFRECVELRVGVIGGIQLEQRREGLLLVESRSVAV